MTKIVLSVQDYNKLMDFGKRYTARDDTRPALSYIRIDVEEHAVASVTDGYKAAKVRVPLGHGSEVDIPTFLLPVSPKLKKSLPMVRESKMKEIKMTAILKEYKKWSDACKLAAYEYNRIPMKERKPYDAPHMQDKVIAARDAMMKAAKRLDDEIKKVEGRATARTLDVATICGVLRRVEGRVPTKKALDGTAVYYDAGEKFAKAYKYVPESTHFDAIFAGGSWYVIDIHRDTCPNSASDGKIYYSEDAKQAILQELAKL